MVDGVMPGTLVVSITIAAPRTRAFSKGVPPLEPETRAAGVRPSMRVLFWMSTMSSSPGSVSVKEPPTTS